MQHFHVRLKDAEDISLLFPTCGDIVKYIRARHSPKLVQKIITRTIRFGTITTATLSRSVDTFLFLRKAVQRSGEALISVLLCLRYPLGALISTVRQNGFYDSCDDLL